MGSPVYTIVRLLKALIRMARRVALKFSSHDCKSYPNLASASRVSVRAVVGSDCAHESRFGPTHRPQYEPRAKLRRLHRPTQFPREASLVVSQTFV